LILFLSSRIAKVDEEAIELGLVFVLEYFLRVPVIGLREAGDGVIVIGPLRIWDINVATLIGFFWTRKFP